MISTSENRAISPMTCAHDVARAIAAKASSYQMADRSLLWVGASFEFTSALPL
jgi:hypothetical protein